MTHRGGEAAAGPWQRPRKPLIFPTLTIIRAAQKQAQWQMRLLSAGARAKEAASLSEGLLSHIYRFLRSVFLLSSEPGAFHTLGCRVGRAGASWSLSAVVLAFHQARPGEWVVSGSESGGEARQCGRRSIRLQRRLGTDSGPRELPFIEQLL